MQRSFAMIGTLLLAGLAGCAGNPMSMATTAGGAAFKTFKGAEADATPIKLLTANMLASYQTVRVGQITTDVPPICTPEIMSKVRQGLQEGMAAEDVRKAFPGGGKALKFDVSCRFYKGKGMIGGEGRLDWMVTLIDAQSNESLGVVFVEGVSESPLQHGATDMAKANTKELMKFLRKYKKGA